MKHNRKKDVFTVIRRKKTWDHFGWGYQHQPNRLWKNQWLSCDCAKCKYEQYLKYLENKRIRNLAKRIIAYELEESV